MTVNHRHRHYPSALLLFLFLIQNVILVTFTTAVDADDADNTDPNASETETPPQIVVSIDIELGSGTTTTTNDDDDDAEDQNEKCEEWANAGECIKNPGFMLEKCSLSCKGKGTFTANAYVMDGEDAGIGAFRFAEEYSTHFQEDSTTETVMDVAKQLQDALVAKNYNPPTELTKCGKRPCSAGKLWKRAEEMRKADMHDAAGADLIRALMKSGIEIDFIERCKRSLQWAFGSIKRQREREAREAFEQEKIEKRRQEEKAAMEEAMVRFYCKIKRKSDFRNIRSSHN